MEKELPIYRLDIVEDLDSNVEVDFVALVDRPAIEKSFLAFQDSYSDYPDSVKNNARKVLNWTEENGWGDCGTPVGKQRANQLANGEPISFETIKRIAKTLGLKKYPTAKFRDIDIRDKTQLMRVTTRLMELGIITPQQGIDMFHTGEFPKSEDIAPSQPEFVSQRKEGYYNPIVGGIPTISPPEPKDTTDSGPINATPKVAGRPEGTTGIPLAKAKVSVKNIRGIVSKIEELHASIESELKASLSLETLSDNQQEMVNKLCETVIVSSNLESWAEVASSCVKDFEAIASLSTLPEVLEAAAEFEIDDDYSAALLYHSSGLV